MRIEAVELRVVELPLVAPFAASHGTVAVRSAVLVRVVGPDGEGWGECAALPEPTYTSEYVAGALGIFDPATSQAVQIDDIPQLEGGSFAGNTMYLGTYPRARIYRYEIDPAKLSNVIPGEGKAPRKNPKELFRLEGYHQDRPYGMLGIEETGQCVISTIPDYGKLGGLGSGGILDMVMKPCDLGILLLSELVCHGQPLAQNSTFGAVGPGGVMDMAVQAIDLGVLFLSELVCHGQPLAQNSTFGAVGHGGVMDMAVQAVDLGVLFLTEPVGDCQALL